MVVMDNHGVAVGDKVYDVRYGAGKVAGTDPTTNSIMVDFESPKTQLVFSNTGRHGSNRRSLFWHNPIVAPPPKDEWRWVEVTHLMKDVVKCFERIRNASN